jgi:hypothetical protein
VKIVVNLIKNVYAETTLPADWIGTSSYIDTVGGLLGLLVNVVFYIGVAVCLAFAIVGGIRYATSGGDPKATGEARQTITNAIIGFLIVVGFRFVMHFVLQLINAQGQSVPQDVLPTSW